MAGKNELQVQNYRWMKVPVDLLAFQKTLGITDTEFRFILGVLMCESLRIAPTPQNLRMPKPTISSVKRRLIKKQLMVKPKNKFNPYGGFYDISPLWSKLSEISQNPPVPITEDSSDFQENLQKLTGSETLWPQGQGVVTAAEMGISPYVPSDTEVQLKRLLDGLKDCATMPAPGEEPNALPEAEVGREADAVPGTGAAGPDSVDSKNL